MRQTGDTAVNSVYSKFTEKNLYRSIKMPYICVMFVTVKLKGLHIS